MPGASGLHTRQQDSKLGDVQQRQKVSRVRNSPVPPGVLPPSQSVFPPDHWKPISACPQGHPEGPRAAPWVQEAPPAQAEGPGSSLAPPPLHPAMGQLRLPSAGDGAAGPHGIPIAGRRAGEGF